MKFPEWLTVFGDASFRGECPKEEADMKTAFNQIKKRWPELGAIAIHPKNEGKRTKGQFRQLQADKLTGYVSGASDIIIPGCPTFVCELKRADHTKSSWQPGQLDYLQACQDQGAFVCVALGWQGVIEAIEAWIVFRDNHHGK